MMEAKIVLAMIAGAFELQLGSAHAVELDPGITLRPKNGMPMTIAPRTPTAAFRAPRSHGAAP
jgi:hypothetical protein